MDNEEYKINFEKAEGYLKKGNFNQAIREFETVLEKWPDDSRCYNKLGVCYASLKDFVKAKSYLKKALVLDLKYAEPYNNLGNICLEEKKYEKSIELYKRALELNPDYAAAHSNLGLAYKRTKRINEAVKHFKMAAEIDRKAPLSEIKKIKTKTKTKSNIIIFMLILAGVIILWFLLKK
ncbi:MAG: tetratricopeptide repeat protein [Candidatus Caldatribacteriota bacterium]|nr:tetratricopeptide repeat protein [Candidatus Caldatribacteriota bacterium]